MSTAPRWLPLESNPDVMTKFLVNLGVSPEWSVVDVLGFDPELLAFVPQPVAALILLYPVSTCSSSDEGRESETDSVYFIKQTIHNACGTIALIHAVSNNRDKLQLSDGSLLKNFLDTTESLSPAEKGKALEASEDVCTSHATCAQEGQTAPPALNDELDYHFIALVERGGRLYELDGRKKGPIDHGPTTPENLLNDAAAVCREFIARNPGCLNFTSVALVKATSDTL